MKKYDYSFAEAFGPDFPTDQHASGYEHENHPFQVEQSPSWLWDRAFLLDMIIWWKHGENDPCYIFGPPGSGKSKSVKNYCAALGVPLYEVTVHQDMEFNDLLIDRDLIDGTTINNYSSLPLAMGVENAPGILLLNELDKGSQAFHAGLFEVLEGAPIGINNGGLEYIKPQPYFRIIGTGNTAMMGDHLGLHPGSESCDVAFNDRFWKFKRDYLTFEQESEILGMIAPDIHEDTRNAMVEVAREIREMSMYNNPGNDAIPLTMSTRTLARWARMTHAYRGLSEKGINPIDHALQRALTNAADLRPEWSTAINEVVKGKLGNLASGA